jgi:hypothetical protein
MRPYIKRRPRRSAPPALTDDQREELKVLRAAVPAGAREDDPEFVQLVEFWWSLDYEVRRGRAPVYRHRRGGWFTAGVPEVLDAVKRVVESV